MVPWSAPSVYCGTSQSAPIPETGADQDNRDAARLYRSVLSVSNLGEFIQRTKPTGHDHIGGGKFDEHHLAGEKMAESQRHILIRIGLLLMRQAQCSSRCSVTCHAKRTLVCRFHNTPGPPPLTMEKSRHWIASAQSLQ